jgi:mono/diheme cytochrome c family protein
LNSLFRGRASRVIRTIALTACTAAAGCSRSAPAAEPAAVDASALFAQACAKCHGAEGSGGLAMVANGPRPIDLTSPEWQRGRSDQELVAAIRTGRGAMPPFADVLTAQQIDALGSYVRTLKRSQPHP